MSTTIGGVRERTTRQAPTKRELLLIRAEVLEQMGAGVEPSTITVSEWLDRWMQTAELKATTRSGYESHITHSIKPHVGRIRLQKLTSTDVREMILALRTEPSPKTRGTDHPAPLSAASIRQAHAILRRALTVAERDRLITHNPARHIELPKNRAEPHAILTREQAMAVIDCTADLDERVRIMLALMVGLRQGEALGLRWGDLDLEAGTLTVREAASRVRGEWVMDEPKSRRSKRTIPLPAALLDTLRLLRMGQSEQTYVVGGGETPVMPRADHSAWKAACRRAGVPEVPLHGARGTLETMLIHAGVTITDSAAMLGHDPLTAQRHYAHATEQSRRALADRIGGLYGAPAIETETVKGD
ncbi:tyrosine-type recombinase/integrase [Aestuariimicrobium soli]|uniref:tyrosine-type recombinase/integrase n=1 Tax=Aestuariimicrobium soli TaxID=2035834 RepID=UPI003EBF3231